MRWQIVLGAVSAGVGAMTGMVRARSKVTSTPQRDASSWRRWPEAGGLAIAGRPDAPEFGLLGAGSADLAVHRLEALASHMRQPVAGALCLTVAAESLTPGRDRSFVDHLDDEVLDQYSQAAENAEVWLILQIQHRRGGAYEAVQKWAHWLERPHVGVFLDGDSDRSGPSDDIAEAVRFLEALVDTKRPPSKPVLITGYEQVMSGTHPTRIIQLHQVDSLPTSVEAGTWTILV